MRSVPNWSHSGAAVGSTCSSIIQRYMAFFINLCSAAPDLSISGRPGIVESEVVFQQSCSASAASVFTQCLQSEARKGVVIDLPMALAFPGDADDNTTDQVAAFLDEPPPETSFEFAWF